MKELQQLKSTSKAFTRLCGNTLYKKISTHRDYDAPAVEVKDGTVYYNTNLIKTKKQIAAILDAFCGCWDIIPVDYHYNPFCGLSD